MNNAVGYGRPAQRDNDVVLGTDGIGADMLEEFRLAYVAHRADDVLAVPGHGVELGDERLPLPAGVRRRPRDVDLRPRRFAVARRLHAWDPGDRRGEWHRRGTRRRRACRRASISPRSAPTPPSKPPASSPASDRRSDVPGVRCWPHGEFLVSGRPVPAGRPSDRRGHRVRAPGRGGRLRRRVAGRQPARARCRRPDGRLRRRHRADQGRLGRHRHLDTQRGAPRQHVLDARRSRSRTDPLRARRLVGPARHQGRHRASTAADRDARSRSPPCAACSATSR